MESKRSWLSLLAMVNVVTIGQTSLLDKRAAFFCMKSNLVPVENLDTQRLAGRWYVAGVSAGGWHMPGVSSLGASSTGLTGQAVDIDFHPVMDMTMGFNQRKFLVFRVNRIFSERENCSKSSWLCQLHADVCVRPVFLRKNAVVWTNTYVVATDYDSVLVLFHEIVVDGLAVPMFSELQVAVRDPTAPVNMTAVEQPLTDFCGQWSQADDLQSPFYVTLDNDSHLPCFAA